MISSEKNKIYFIIFFSIVISSTYYFLFVPNLNEKKIYKFTIIVKPINIVTLDLERGGITKKLLLPHSEFISLFLNKIEKNEIKKICEIKNISSKKILTFDYYLHIEKTLNEHLQINFNADDICFKKIKLIIYETHKELLNGFNSTLNMYLSQGLLYDYIKFYNLQINDKIKNLENYSEFKKKEINKKYEIFLICLFLMITSFLLMSFIFFNKYIFYFFQIIKKKNFYKSANKIKSIIRS